MHRPPPLLLAPLVVTLALGSVPLAAAGLDSEQDSEQGLQPGSPPGSVAIRVLDRPVEEPSRLAAHHAAMHRTHQAGGLAERTSSTTDSLLVPYFQVDRRSKRGITTLFAVRNETGRPLPVRILYLNSLESTPQVTQEINLGPRAVHTVNLRDVPDLETDADGMARGLVLVGVIGGWQDDSDFLSGDFIVLDPATGFSTGNNLVNVSLDDPENEFCASWGSRFFNGGAPRASSALSFTVDQPGGDAAYDPPTAVGTVYDEGGEPIRSFEIRTALHTFHLPVESLAPPSLPFGSLSIAFVGTEGVLLVEHAGANRVALGMKAVCRDRVPAD